MHPAVASMTVATMMVAVMGAAQQRRRQRQTSSHRWRASKHLTVRAPSSPGCAPGAPLLHQQCPLGAAPHINRHGPPVTSSMVDACTSGSSNGFLAFTLYQVCLAVWANQTNLGRCRHAPVLTLTREQAIAAAIEQAGQLHQDFDELVPIPDPLGGLNCCCHGSRTVPDCSGGRSADSRGVARAVVCARNAHRSRPLRA